MYIETNDDGTVIVALSIFLGPVVLIAQRRAVGVSPASGSSTGRPR